MWTLALSLTGSQLIAIVLHTVSAHGCMIAARSNVSQANKDERALLYESICGPIVTLHGCKTGSKVIWLLYVFDSLETQTSPDDMTSDRMVRNCCPNAASSCRFNQAARLLRVAFTRRFEQLEMRAWAAYDMRAAVEGLSPQGVQERI